MRRLAGAVFVVVGTGLLLSGGWAAAAGPTDPVSQDVPVGGDPEALLVFAANSRNASCSVSRNVLNRTDDVLDVRVLSATGEELDWATLGGGEQVTFSIDHELVTVPLLLQVAGEEPLELAQVGPFPPCDEPVTTEPPPTPDDEPELPPSPPSSVPGPTVTTLAPSAPPAPSTTAPPLAPASPPATTASSAPTVSVLSAQASPPSVTRLPATGRDTRPTTVLGVSSIAVGLAFVATSRTARAAARRDPA